MLTLIKDLLIAISQTYFAWHLWTCDTHSRFAAFLFTLLAGGAWLVVAAAICFVNKKSTED